jgi:SAM-dependent methyltransferase
MRRHTPHTPRVRQARGSGPRPPVAVRRTCRRQRRKTAAKTLCRAPWARRGWPCDDHFAGPFLRPGRCRLCREPPFLSARPAPCGRGTRPPSLKGARVADAGAGTGLATALLHARGARVIAVEPGPAMAARFRLRLPDVPLVLGDGNSLPPASGSVTSSPTPRPGAGPTPAGPSRKPSGCCAPAARSPSGGTTRTARLPG